MLNVPVQNSSYVKQGAERFKPSSGSRGLIIVDAIALGKTFSNITNFVSSDVSSIVTFTFANQFTLERTLATRDIRAGNQDEDIEVF
jgi:hypothetical protein